MLRVTLTLTLLLYAANLGACPLCDSATGAHVRAELFGDNFWPHLLVTLLPFLVLAGIVLAIHRYGSLPDKSLPSQRHLTAPRGHSLASAQPLSRAYHDQ
ncbi:MAG: hypothetical protein SFX18_03470 [Pirellulales bacterium]|nr:hypothetical protein [Pirellulales bacterium]